MNGLLIVVGALVSIGTPLGTYVATRKGHAVSEDTARIAANTARHAADVAAKAARDAADLTAETARHTAALTAETAAAANQTTEREQLRAHLRWAYERAWSEHPTTSRGGIAILRSRFDDGGLHHADLVELAGVLEALTSPAVDRVGDPTQGDIAAPSSEGDAGTAIASGGGDG